MALLHSFQYEEAGKAFSEITQQDPHCAMAYWGLAMSLYQQLWNFPDAATLKKGYKDVEKARNVVAKTDREREYIAAAAAFYQNDPKLSHTARTEAYSKAMAEIYERNPADVNAGAFYALSLVALAQDGVNDLQNRKHAIAILDKLFATHPDNPGVDHYLIHASDDPRLASFGLAAARNYAKIAPDSAHALHMPSHIFTRLGYWQDSVHSNLASAAAAEEATQSGRDDEWGYQMHALSFLEYAYLQSGRSEDARRVVGEVMKVPGDTTALDLAENQALFEVTYAIENHAWKTAAALTLPAGDRYAGDSEEIYWARTIGAARRGDVAGARQDFQKLKEASAAVEIEVKKRGEKPASGESVAQMEAEAWLDDAEGHHHQAVEMMRAAAAKEGPYGVDILGMPAQEMLGDLLMELHQPRPALAAYESGLKESPNRFDGLYGAARAAELAGDTGKARAYYAQLVKICGSEADRKEYREARVFLAKN
ncbi:MAG: tetratricopeptide repeat protein [Terriglobia bacterium]